MLGRHTEQVRVPASGSPRPGSPVLVRDALFRRGWVLLLGGVGVIPPALCSPVLPSAQAHLRGPQRPLLQAGSRLHVGAFQPQRAHQAQQPWSSRTLSNPGPCSTRPPKPQGHSCALLGLGFFPQAGPEIGLSDLLPLNGRTPDDKGVVLGLAPAFHGPGLPSSGTERH